jgi:NADH dehydrogenase
VHIRGVEIRGVAAWIVWRAIFLGFVPTWDRKLRILVDWVVTAIFGRNIANIRMNEPYGLREEMYEPGQAIVREGDVGQRLFIISEGEVDVVRAGNDGSEERLATLGPGQHFGEMAVFGRTRRSATVRARTRVHLLSLGEVEALNLSRTMETFGERVRRLPGQERADRGQAG